MKNRNIILLSGGVGSRFGEAIPKQYYKMHTGETILKKSMSNFPPEEFDNVVIVCDPQFEELAVSEIKKLGFKNVLTAKNGSTRHQSIVNGVVALENYGVKDDSHVFLQESVRPFVTKEMIDILINYDKRAHNVSPGISPIVLYSHLTNGKAHKLIKKDSLVELQLPKRYTFGKMSKLLPRNIDGESVLDESQFFIDAGMDVEITEGSRGNIKVTFIDDKDYL